MDYEKLRKTTGLTTEEITRISDTLKRVEQIKINTGVIRLNPNNCKQGALTVADIAPTTPRTDPLRLAIIGNRIPLIASPDVFLQTRDTNEQILLQNLLNPRFVEAVLGYRVEFPPGYLFGYLDTERD